MTNGLGAWGVLQAPVEAAGLLKRRERAAGLYPLVRQMMASGTVVLWTYGLVEKTAGIAGAAGNAWDAAEAHFENALRLAAEMPHRVEQSEVRRWYARMLLDRNGAARVLSAEARHAYAEIGMPKHIARVDIMLNELGI